MVHKNQTDGLVLINMLVIGKIIRKMDLEFSIIKMEINMKVDGLIIKDMDRVLFGSVIQKIS
jgi:hypothetical protein